MIYQSGQICFISIHNVATQAGQPIEPIIIGFLPRSKILPLLFVISEFLLKTILKDIRESHSSAVKHLALRMMIFIDR